MYSENIAQNKKPSIIFFDGVCGLCNRFVDWIIKRDLRKTYTFAPLQGTTARQYINSLKTNDTGDTIIFIEGPNRYERSTAALKIIIGLGGGWRFWKFLFYLPVSFRDFFYRLIARSRYRFFGKKDACRLPTPQEKERFLP